MAVTHDANSSVTSGTTTVASQSWTHTVSGSDTLLVVGISWLITGGITMTVTNNGSSANGTLTQTNANSSYGTQVWYFINPPTGSNTLLATPSSAANIFGGAVSFNGANQISPIGNTNRNTGTSFGAISLNTTTSIGSMLFSTVGMTTITNAITPTENQAYNVLSSGAINRTAAGSYSTPTGPGSNSMTWTIGGSTNRSWAFMTAEIKTAPVPRNGFVNFQGPGVL